MSEVTLRATTGRPQGSAASRRLRRDGSIPAVVYGEGVGPIVVAVDAKEFRHAVSTDQGLNTLITLDADGSSYTVMAREVQRHPVRGTVAHIDFQVVDPNRPVVVDVPLHLTGDAIEVRHADWEVDQQLFSIELRSRPDQIPTAITVDISTLVPGNAIRVGDLEIPEGVTAQVDPQVTVVATHPGRAAKPAGPEAEPE